MNLKQFKTDTNFWIILGTIAFLALGYIFYLNYYKVGKEDRITSTRFRVLDQIGDNMDAKLSSENKNVIDQKDKIEKILESNQKESDIKKMAEIIDKKLKMSGFNPALKVVNIVEEEYHNKTEPTGSKENYYFTLKIDPSSSTGFQNSVVVVEARYDKLMGGLPREDVFDGLILIRDSLVIHNTLDQDMILTSSYVLDTIVKHRQNTEKKKNGSVLSNTSKNVSNKEIIFSGMVFDIDISNRPYKAFLKPVEVNEDSWYLIGLMESSNYNATSRSIAPWIIVLLSFLLIFIILGLPVIKLRVMSKNEELETRTIISFALSLILGGSLTILFVYFLMHNLSRNQNVDRDLQALSSEIYDAFKEEINMVFKQLDVYNSLSHDTTNFNFWDSISNPYNTNVKRNILSEGNTSKYYPSYYEFADYYFFVNDSGMQSVYMTPFKEFGTMSNLNSRDYVNRKDEWYFRNDSTRKFRLESIVSLTSGIRKVAMSMPGENKRDTVVALTSRFYSIIDPIIPKDFKFCIIDMSGKVWFHSDKKRNLNENFIAECNENKHLSAAIYRDISKAININYYNNPHQIYLRKIDHFPLYLITMYNRKADSSAQAQVITLTLLLLGALLFMLFTLIVALLIIERRFQWKLTKNNIMKLTRPRKHLNETFHYLMKVNVVITIVLIPFMVWLQNLNAVIAIFTLTIYLFSYMYWMLNDNEVKRKARIWFMGFNLCLLLLINFAGGFLNKGQGFIDVLAFQFAIIAIISVFDLFIKGDLHVSGKNYINTYTRSLLVLLILLGLIPALKFYEISTNTEVEIQTKHMQIDLMKQREIRNADIGNYYKRVNSSENVRKILEERKNLGIFSEFLNKTSFDSITEEYNSKAILQGDTSNYWDMLISCFRPFYEDAESKYLIFNNTEDSRMGWQQIGNDSLLFQYVSLTEDPENKNLLIKKIRSQITLSSFYLPFQWSENKFGRMIIYNTIFWILVIGLLYIFYQLIRFGTRQIYCLDIIENYSHQSFINHIRRHLMAKNSLMITRLSSIDETNDLCKELSNTPDTLCLNWSDTKEIWRSPVSVQNHLEELNKKLKDRQEELEDKATSGKSPTVVLDHFDWSYDDPKILSLKLEIVYKLIEQDGYQLVLLSQVDERIISTHYQNLIDQKSGTGEDIKSWRKQVSELNKLLKLLVVVRQPVYYHRSYKNENKPCNAPPVKLTLKELIEEELSASDYLKQFKAAMDDYYKNHFKKNSYQDPEENIIRRLDHMAEKYYSDLLNSCSLEEKHVLYDIADDLIVNPKNKASILSLLRKGLLIKKCDRITLFNMSFRRFVMSSLNKAQAAEIKVKMSKEAGTWRGYRITFTIVIIALFVFIAMANQSFFNNLNQLFILIGGGVTVITGVLGLLSRKYKSTGE